MGETEKGKKIAIVIGCEKYDSEDLENLKFAEKDATAVAELLKEKDICGFDEVVSFSSSSDSTKINIEIQKILRNARRDDSLLLYFSGHGVRDTSGGRCSLYLATRNTDKKAPQFTAISTTVLLQQLEECMAARKSVILDCCFAGAFGSKSAGNTAEVIETFKTDYTGEGMFVFAACQKHEEAKETDKYGHGVFTHYVLQGLKGAADGAVDGEVDGYITPYELYKYVQQKTEADPNTHQVPEKLIDTVKGGDFYIVESVEKINKIKAEIKSEIDTFVKKHDYNSASSLAKDKKKKFDTSRPAISKYIDELINDIEREKTLAINDYISKIRNDAEIKPSELGEILSFLEKDPDVIFESKSSSTRVATLNLHFRGNIDSVALAEFWRGYDETKVNVIPELTIPAEPVEPDEPVTPVTPVIPPEPVNYWLKVKKHWPFVASLVLIVSVIISYGSFYSPTSVDLKKLQFGFVQPKTKWDAEIYVLFLEELNKKLAESGAVFRFSEKQNLKPLHKNDEGRSFETIVEHLKSGTIQVAGELRPRQVYDANKKIGAEPFISPKYSAGAGAPPSDNYNAVIFSIREYEADALVNDLINIKNSQLVLQKNSASGYDYPRFWLIKRLEEKNEDKLKKNKKLIKELISTKASSSDVFDTVVCKNGRYKAGVVAEYLFNKWVKVDGSLKIDADGKWEKEIKKGTWESPCNKDDLDADAVKAVRLHKVTLLNSIPTGAFVIGNIAELRKGKIKLHDAWVGAIASLYKKAAGDELKGESGKTITVDNLKDKFYPKDWSIRHDMNAYNVSPFYAEDSVIEKINRDFNTLFLVVTSILVLVVVLSFIVPLLRHSRSGSGT